MPSTTTTAPCGAPRAWVRSGLKSTSVKEDIRTIWTQWEYGTQFYQYLIETSLDGKSWDIFADKRDNRLAGSPMVDFGNTEARYVSDIHRRPEERIRRCDMEHQDIRRHRGVVSAAMAGTYSRRLGRPPLEQQRGSARRLLHAEVG